jgi:xylulokinase
MSLLGVDVGTTGCKAAVFSEDGKLLGLAYQEYDFQRPEPGWAELDSAQVWLQIKGTIRKAVADAGLGSSGDPVQALCVSSLGESVVPVTPDRKILGPSPLNFDVRGEEYLSELHDLLPNERLYRINGNTLGNNYSLTKLLWMKQNQPELYGQTALFLHWSGFVSFMLGAEPAVDYSLANRTLLFDIDRQDWSAELLEWTGLDGDKLPRPVPSGTRIGSVSDAMAEELGLPRGAAIVSGVHDQSANAVGCGVIEDGQAVFGMGTYICITPVFGQRRPAGLMIERGLNTEHHAVPGKYVCFIYNQGGSLVKWLRDTFAAAEHRRALEAGKDIYEEIFTEIPEEIGKILVLPHFSITGPPDFISDSCGVIAGLRLDTSRGDILQGIIESTAFNLKEVVSSLPPTGIQIQDYRAVGGGSKSEVWVQTCANIFGRPFTRPHVTEAGALGAAIVAGVGSGVFASYAQGVEAMVRLERTFEPDARRRKQYEAKYEKYCKLWPLMADYLREIS